MASGAPTSRKEAPSGSRGSSFAPPPKGGPPTGYPGARPGNHDTCLAFACTAVRPEPRRCSVKAAPAKKDLSEQFLLLQCKLRDHYPGSGTLVTITMRVCGMKGFVPKRPWRPSANSIPRTKSRPFRRGGGAGSCTTRALSRSPPAGCFSCRWRLSEGGPVAFAVPVYASGSPRPWRDSGDIRLPLPAGSEGGHAMCMVGYEDDEAVPGGGYFLVRKQYGDEIAARE